LLENEKIQLRAVEPKDLDLLYHWENNPSYWHAGEVRTLYSKFALKQFILSSGKDVYENKQLRFMIESKDLKKTVGTIDLFDFDVFNSRIGIGILIEKTFQNNGFAATSVELIKEYVFSYLKIHQIYAHVAETNETSTKLFEKCGFEKTSVLKDWISTEAGFANVFLFQTFNRHW